MNPIATTVAGAGVLVFAGAMLLIAIVIAGAIYEAAGWLGFVGLGIFAVASYLVGRWLTGLDR